MSVILKFGKTITKETIVISSRGLTIEDCRIYTVTSNNDEIGKFYTNLNLSYGKVADKEIIITYQSKLFKKPICYIKDALTNNEVALLRQSNNAVNLKMTLDIPDQYQYHWEDITHKYASLFKPTTWKLYVAKLSNGPQEILFTANFHSKKIDTVFESHIPLSGEVEIFDKFDPLLIICGMHMLETDLYYRNRGGLD